jgi:diguanylate cyclase (GGDEF)-like protein/PAS domain S-box-containing protein
MPKPLDQFVVSAVDWQTIVDALQEGVGVLDPRGRILACNQAAAAMLGRSASELIGRTPLELDLSAVGEDGEPLAVDEYPSAKASRTGQPVREQVVGVLDSEGQRRWLSVSATPMGEEARPAAVVLTFRDVTERRDYEAELRRLAEVDELTGLPNRRAFLAALADHLASRRREDSRGALLVLDLDRFKELNDTLGHAVGDRLLMNAARAMEDRLRATDFVGRLAGDEFAVLLPRADEAEAEQVAAILAERLREERVPTTQGGVRQLSASIGIVPLSGGAGASVDRALQSADDAMYAAKAAGRDGWHTAARPAAPDSAVQMGVQLAKRARQLALANALGERLHEMTEIGEIAEATVEELHRAFGYHMCAVIRVRGECVDALAVRGSPFVALAMREWSQPVGDGLIGRCLRERAPLLVNDVHADADYAVTPETADVRAELVVPLVVEGGAWGALNLEELVEDAFDDDDAQLLCIVANQVAAAIRSAQLTQRLLVQVAAPEQGGADREQRADPGEHRQQRRHW